MTRVRTVSLGVILCLAVGAIASTRVSSHRVRASADSLRRSAVLQSASNVAHASDSGEFDATVLPAGYAYVSERTLTDPFGQQYVLHRFSNDRSKTIGLTIVTIRNLKNELAADPVAQTVPPESAPDWLKQMPGSSSAQRKQIGTATGIITKVDTAPGSLVLSWAENDSMIVQIVGRSLTADDLASVGNGMVAK